MKINLISNVLEVFFLGYSNNQKSYIYLYQFGKVYVSRHVVFNECTFPFAATPNIFSKTFLPRLFLCNACCS